MEQDYLGITWRVNDASEPYTKTNTLNDSTTWFDDDSGYIITTVRTTNDNGTPLDNTDDWQEVRGLALHPVSTSASADPGEAAYFGGLISFAHAGQDDNLPLGRVTGRFYGLNFLAAVPLTPGGGGSSNIAGVRRNRQRCW
jgi:hypothetical protein